MAYTFEYIQTNVLDPNTDGSDVEIIFKCEKFLYTVRSIYGDIQYVRGENVESYSIWSPTELEIEAHDLREEELNADHSIIQTWIDSL